MIEIKKHNAGTFCNSIRIAHAPRQPEKAAGKIQSKLVTVASRVLRCFLRDRFVSQNYLTTFDTIHDFLFQ
jgi:hypothetical protein